MAMTTIPQLGPMPIGINQQQFEQLMNDESFSTIAKHAFIISNLAPLKFDGSYCKYDVQQSNRAFQKLISLVKAFGAAVSVALFVIVKRFFYRKSVIPAAILLLVDYCGLYLMMNRVEQKRRESLIALSKKLEKTQLAYTFITASPDEIDRAWNYGTVQQKVLEIGLEIRERAIAQYPELAKETYDEVVKICERVPVSDEEKSSLLERYREKVIAMHADQVNRINGLLLKDKD